jgi:hypothetical protein
MSRDEVPEETMSQAEIEELEAQERADENLHELDDTYRSSKIPYRNLFDNNTITSTMDYSSTDFNDENFESSTCGVEITGEIKMPFNEITIYRDLPIINNFVQIAPNRESDKTRVSMSDAIDDIGGSTLESLSVGSGRSRGSKYGKQHWVRLPGVAADSWYESDPVDEIR